MELLVYNAEIDPNPESDLEVTFIGLVDKPAIERNFQAFNEHKKRAAFILNEEKRIISGPAMIPDLPMYRKDDQLGEYYVIFGKDQIRIIAQKFHSKGYMTKFNLFHKESARLNDVEIFSSFQSDSELGIAPIKNFEDLPDGTWFISAKVNGDDTWGKVKAGEIKGFSVEGLFTYIPVAKVKMSAEALVFRIQKLLNETEITD